MPSAIIYCRVSTQAQADDGISLDAQEAKSRAWCELNDYTVTAVEVDAGISGRRADNRPALQKALAALQAGDALICYSLSRLARSTRDAIAISEALQKRGADLVSLSEKIDTTTAAGKMVFRMLAVMAEFESDLTAERTSLALQHKRANGEFTGGKAAPYGYAVGEDGKTLELVDAEQQVIALIRQYRAEGLTLQAISNELARAGIMSRSNKPFAPIQVSRIAKAA